MLRTIEVSIVVMILATAFIASTFFAGLPSPRQVSPLSLKQLGLTTLQVLDTNKALTEVLFKSVTDPAWANLEIALSASLPPNIVYNFTVYDMTKEGDTLTYTKYHSITNSETGLGTNSEAATYLATSTDVTFTTTPQRISGTLYILNCSDAAGWWITGYTGQTLAEDLYNLISPYFNTTVIVQSTTDLERLLNGTKISSYPHENVANAVIVNTFGESVPIPAGYYTTEGYDSSHDSYAAYSYILGQRTRQHNWTWVSIVGWPFYYVSNTDTFSSSHNTWGIYGMTRVGAPGLQAYLQGLGNKTYSYGYSQTGSPGIVYFTPQATYYSNYYGIYPADYQTSTRALPSSILATYDLTVSNQFGYVFQPTTGWIAGATYSHTVGSEGEVQGAFTAIGLTRIPDIRITALALLMYYHPTIYKSIYTSTSSEQPTQRLVVLQLSQQGGG